MKLARRLFFVTFTLSLMLEALGYGYDPVAQLGWYFHQDLKKWLPIGIAFSLQEICLIACALLWFGRSYRERRKYPLQRGGFVAPMVALAVALAIGVLWGVLRGGDNLTFALFEVRDLALLVFAYFLVGMLVRDERDLGRLVWCILIACTVLTIDNTVRALYIVPQGSGSATNDLLFDHDDSIMLDCGLILCLALLVFRGTRGQRRYAAVLWPCILICLGVMQRRAAFASLALGLVMLAIIMFRLRPRLFWRMIPPVALLIGLYLGVFWNNQSIFGQPARAIRSTISPDPRDASSNLYRVAERANILANISTSRYLGLGFGQPYAFYYPLADLSFWPFWHYEAHNSVLWLWMDGGIPVFFAFWWVAGSGMYRGGQALALHREAWSPRQLRRSGPRPRRTPSPVAVAVSPVDTATAAQVVTLARSATSLSPKTRKATKPSPLSPLEGTTIAVLATGTCLIGMQILFSYVDIGLTSDRDMLLLGVMLGVLGRTFAPAILRSRPPRRIGQSLSPVVAPDPAEPAGMTPQDEAMMRVGAREHFASAEESRP